MWIKASISPVYDVLAHLQNLVMTFSDITEERQIRQLEGNILAAMCSSPPFHEMGEIICRNIESVLNESHVSLFALRNGMPNYLALVRDASVEMAQKEQTRQLIIAVDHLDRPVIVLDPERHIVQCNRAFTEMFGYCISEASGMQPDTLLNIPEFPADNRIRLQQLLWKTARDQDEFLLLTRTG
ncbi:TPA: PAS domain S-box protein, partial [Escherichia coli]